MIDQAKLDALSVETLSELKTRIEATLERKRGQWLRVGAMAQFWFKGNARIAPGWIKVRVVNFGPKNVMCNHYDAHGNEIRHPRGYTWRVHPSSLKPLPAAAPAPALRYGSANDRPASSYAPAF